MSNRFGSRELAYKLFSESLVVLKKGGWGDCSMRFGGKGGGVAAPLFVGVDANANVIQQWYGMAVRGWRLVPKTISCV